MQLCRIEAPLSIESSTTCAISVRFFIAAITFPHSSTFIELSPKKRPASLASLHHP